MKAVLLARGLGSRMKHESDAHALSPAQSAAADAGAKGMMPIGDSRTRPFLDYVLSALADSGCTDVCFVVAPEHSAIRDYYEGAGRPTRLRVAFAVQPVADGTAHAVLSAEHFAGQAPFLVLNSDNLYPTRVLQSLAQLDGPGLPAFERDSLVNDSGFPAERVASFAAIEIDDDGDLVRIVEKPGRAYYDAAGPRALISMNLWRFDTAIFDACRDVPKSVRGEYELPEAVGLAASRGVRFRTFRASGAVLDLSRRSDIGIVSERLAAVEARP
ncbi:MAG TPA: nucleotidyltransferase family protein [Vicinamibacterales bacterium]